MSERILLVEIKIKSVDDTASLTDKAIAKLLFKAEFGFNALPTKYRMHVGAFKNGKLPQVKE